VLWFIGLGLNSEKDISLRGLEIARKCKEIYMENYTSVMASFSLENLRELVSKDVVVIGREEMESSSFRREIIEKSANMDIGILVPGEPMAATTHQIFRIEALESGINVGIVHSSSIFSAAPSLLGLHHYKFGRTTSIPKIRNNYLPLSPYEVIEENLQRGLHTLILLDTQPPITANEGLNILLEMESKAKKGVIDENTLVCVVGNAGSFEPVLRCDALGNLIKEDFGPVPHSIVIPGKLHFTEAEALVKICKCPRELVEDFL